MPIYEELFSEEGHKTTPGGAGLNSARGAAYLLKKHKVETKGVAYFGCIGNDKFGDILDRTLKESGMHSMLHRDETTPTGTCACVIVGKERALCANIASSAKYPTAHFDDNMVSNHIASNSLSIQSYIASAKYVYATAFFITSNAECMRKVGRYCAENDKPMVFNIAAGFLLCTNFDDVMDAVEHADFVFCNQDEATEFGKKEGFETEDCVAVAKYIAQYKKANLKRVRVVYITMGEEPIIVAKALTDQVEPEVTYIDVPEVPKESIKKVSLTPTGVAMPLSEASCKEWSAVFPLKPRSKKELLWPDTS